MAELVKRVFVEKRKGFDVEAQQLLADMRENLGLAKLSSLRILKRYDLSGVEGAEYEAARDSILSEPNCDAVYEESFTATAGDVVFAVEYLPGQYDQRADSAAQCIQLLTQKERPLVRSATVYVFGGKLTAQDLATAKGYLVNPVESREASLEKPSTLVMEATVPPDVPLMTGFLKLDKQGIIAKTKEMGLAMSAEDLAFCQQYFRDWRSASPPWLKSRSSTPTGPTTAATPPSTQHWTKLKLSWGPTLPPSSPPTTPTANCASPWDARTRTSA